MNRDTVSGAINRLNQYGFINPDHFVDEQPTFVTASPDGALIFTGRPRVFFLAICRQCNEGRRPLPMPFDTEDRRDTWARGHRTTGHHVDEAIEIRPANPIRKYGNAIRSSH